jgi:hypothetical protein
MQFGAHCTKETFLLHPFPLIKPKETSRTHIPGAVCQFAIREHIATLFDSNAALP